MSGAVQVPLASGALPSAEHAPTLPPGATKTYDARARRIERAVLVGITGIPFVGFVAGVWFLASGRLRLVDHAVFAGMYFLTGFGITVGYHRLLAHRAFRTGPLLRALLAIAGAMAIQGPAIRWVADHRRHHGWTDRPGDPHSPYSSGHGGPRDHEPRSPGTTSSVRGLWHAHLGWFFDEEKTAVRRFALDLVDDRIVSRVDRLYPLWMLASFAIPGAIGLVAGGTSGAYHALVWGGLTRIFLVQHVTWSVNSIGHAFGARDIPTRDASRNNRILAWLSLGEGWHNNHHAFPRSAIQGLRPGELDPSGLLIRALERVGLARDVRRPPTGGVAAHERR